MNKLRHILLFSVVFCLSAVAVFAQSSDSAITRKELNQSEINRIIKNFTTKEGEFRDSLKSYVFNRSAVIQTIGLGGQITGEYRRDSFMTFSESGGRFEKILFAPTPTLTEISVTPEDLDDLGGINPFALWFDKTKTRDEFKRILKKDGFVVLIWNERQLDSTEFLRDYERFLLRFGNDYEQVRHENVTADSLGSFFQTQFQKKFFQNSQTLDFEGLKGRLLSSSYMPASAVNPRFSEMIKTLERLFETHRKNDTIQILYDTNVFYGQI
jgi:hypothetical protein